MSRIDEETRTQYPTYLKPFWYNQDAGGSVPPNTEIGIKAVYYEGMVIPPESRDLDNSEYASLYGVIKAESTINLLTDGKGVWSRLNPIINGFKIENVNRPTITDIPTSFGTSAGNHTLFTINYSNRSGSTVIGYVTVQWGRWQSGYTLAILFKNSPSPTSGSSDDINAIWIPRLSDDSTKSQAISVMNDFISSCEFYIGNSNEYASNFGIYNEVNRVILLVKFGNSYQWIRYGGGGNHCTYYDNTETEIIVNPYIPPEPPEPPTPGDDPYNPGGYSGSGGGPNPDGTGATGTGGLHDDTSDSITIPSTPNDMAISGGLFTAYNPTASQLASFGSALWNMQPTDINDVLRFLFGGDAFNAVIGLHLLPVAPSVGGYANIKLGNWDTGVSAPKISGQYKQVQFGSVLLPEYWGNCIDYAPYTKIQLALPYIGIVDVDTDDVLGSNNTLTYNIDVLSGAICATLHCAKGNLNSVIYQWSGACAVSLPFSGASYNSVLGAIAGIAAAGMGFAAMAAGPIGAALPAAALAAGGGAFSAGSAASIMGTMKGKVQKSGSFGANSGALGIMTPYFILTRPVQSVPETWQADKGYPSNISAQLGTITGYTEVSEINLECSGTEAEKEEIISLLKSGVIF